METWTGVDTKNEDSHSQSVFKGETGTGVDDKQEDSLSQSVLKVETGTGVDTKQEDSLCQSDLFLIGQVHVVPPLFSPFTSICCLTNTTLMSPLF